MQNTTKTYTASHDDSDEEVRGQALISFAVSEGSAFRRVIIDDEETGERLKLIEVWNPDEGGWCPMKRQTTRTVTDHTFDGEKTHVETTKHAYPFHIESLIQDASAWKPTLPLEVMVDVLGAQVGTARRRTRLVLDECERLRRELQGRKDKTRELEERTSTAEAESSSISQALVEVGLLAAAASFHGDELVKQGDALRESIYKLAEKRGAVTKAELLELVGNTAKKWVSTRAEVELLGHEFVRWTKRHQGRRERILSLAANERGGVTFERDLASNAENFMTPGKAWK